MNEAVNEAGRFFERGWARFPRDPAIAAWIAAVRPVAEGSLADAAHRAHWLRCGGTWFAGVNVLPNDSAGAVPGRGVPPLSGGPVDFVGQALGLGGFAWDAGQVSVCFPGYPQPWEGETEAAFRFRRDRDAAHVDGLTRFDGRRRRLGEPHGFILGLPVDDAGPAASPLVVWEGSHEIVRAALRARFAGLAPERWPDEDITDAYVAARRAVFEHCKRVPVHARPGEAYIVHRLALHGVAPWTAGASASRRMIIYLRPDPFPGTTPGWWLERP